MFCEISRPGRSLLKKLLERDIEKYFVKRVKEAGGEIRKLKWIGRSSAPDRIVCFPGVCSFLVELKRPGKVPTDAQAREIARINKAGGSALFINSKEGVDAFIEAL